jgi:hypothetical protein
MEIEKRNEVLWSIKRSTNPGKFILKYTDQNGELELGVGLEENNQKIVFTMDYPEFNNFYGILTAFKESIDATFRPKLSEEQNAMDINEKKTILSSQSSQPSINLSQISKSSFQPNSNSSVNSSINASNIVSPSISNTPSSIPTNTSPPLNDHTNKLNNSATATNISNSSSSKTEKVISPSPSIGDKSSTAKEDQEDDEFEDMTAIENALNEITEHLNENPKSPAEPPMVYPIKKKSLEVPKIPSNLINSTTDDANFDEKISSQMSQKKTKDGKPGLNETDWDPW